MIWKVKTKEDLPKTVEMVVKNEALQMLREAGITKSNGQMLNVWVQSGDLDAYKVIGGRVEERGLYFRKIDIEIFVEYKTLTFKQFKKIKQLLPKLGKEDAAPKGQTTIFDSEY